MGVSEWMTWVTDVAGIAVAFLVLWDGWARVRGMPGVRSRIVPRRVAP